MTGFLRFKRKEEIAVASEIKRRFTDTEMQIVRETDLLELLTHLGYQVKRIGRYHTTAEMDSLRIKVATAALPVSSLSGGNQQKVVVGNWLNTKPTVMMFDEPSRGIDVAAKQQIFKIMWEQSKKGVSSIMVSSELEELLEVCQRILIMVEGRIVREVNPDEMKIDDLYAMCMGDK